MSVSEPGWLHLVAVLMLLSVPFFPSAPSASAQWDEGHIYPVQVDDTVSWQPGPGTYLLVLHASPSTEQEGFEIDISGMRTSNDPKVRLSESHTGTNIAVEFIGNETKSVHVDTGRGLVALARGDLGETSLEDVYDIESNGELPINACRLFFFTQFQMSEPFGVHAQGSGIAFRIFNIDLNPIMEPVSMLSSVYDHRNPENAQLYIQSCRGTEGTGTYRIWVTYPEELPKTESNAKFGVARLSLVIAGLAVFLGMVAIGVRQARRR